MLSTAAHCCHEQGEDRAAALLPLAACLWPRTTIVRIAVAIARYGSRSQGIRVQSGGGRYLPHAVKRTVQLPALPAAVIEERCLREHWRPAGRSCSSSTASSPRALAWALVRLVLPGAPVRGGISLIVS